MNTFASIGRPDAIRHVSRVSFSNHLMHNDGVALLRGSSKTTHVHVAGISVSRHRGAHSFQARRRPPFRTWGSIAYRCFVSSFSCSRFGRKVNRPLGRTRMSSSAALIRCFRMCYTVVPPRIASHLKTQMSRKYHINTSSCMWLDLMFLLPVSTSRDITTEVSSNPLSTVYFASRGSVPTGKPFTLSVVIARLVELTCRETIACRGVAYPRRKKKR